MITKISGRATNLAVTVSVFLCLSCFIFMGTSCSQSAKQDTEKETTKLQTQDTAALLFTYIDSLAQTLAASRYSENDLSAITNYFARNLSISNFDSDKSNPDNTILVSTRLTDETATADIVNISLPEKLRSQITFTQLQNHFGALVPENEDLPRPRQPLPAQINLDKHLGTTDSGMSLFILAADFPDAKRNTINQLQVVKNKK